MRVFIAVLVLILNLQSWTKADDIRDFEIEGMSIGSSALEFLSESQLKNTAYLLGTDDKYLTSYFYDSDYVVYEAVEVSYLKNDKKYIIQGLSGGIIVENLRDCKKKNDEIIKGLKDFFSEAQSISDEGFTPVDTTGKSKFFRTSFQINPSSKYFQIEASCIFYVGEAANEFISSAGITIKTDEMNDWLHNEAYK